MFSFRRIKLKKMTPKISDMLLSYIINSFLFLVKFLELGIAMASLIMARGIAFTSAIL